MSERESIRIVMYRVGEHRRSYHYSGTCHALTGRQPHDAWEAVTEVQAQAEPLNLTACTSPACERARPQR